MRRAEVVVAAFAILQAQQGVAVQVPAAGLFEELGGQQRGQQHLFGAGRYDLGAHDRLDLAQHPDPERQEAVDARTDAAHIAGAEQEDVALAGGVGRGFFECRE